ncbi:MAG TPA: GntR family transcriptional regulator [Thermohalobaculum sp.]|nr:GntR family transcriptional regulator [Thermohalobaculum sp.]
MAKPDHAPLYVQIRSALVARLASGEWKPGAMLPSDRALAIEMGVSLGTMRKTVDSLAADGVLRRHQGKGTFVTEQTPELANYHFFRLVDQHGERVLPQAGSEVVVIIPAGPETQRRLCLGVGENVILIDRFRTIAGRPAILETVEVPAALMPGLERETPLPNALYPHYQARHGISVISTDDRLSAVAADAIAAMTLDVPEGAPLLLVERVAYDLTGRAVEWRRSRFLSGGLAYAVTLG